MRRASEVALMFAESGSTAFVTLISPLRKDRDKARALHEGTWIRTILRIGAVVYLPADSRASAWLMACALSPGLGRGIPFLEVFIDVPLSVAQERDPKGLYKKVAAGEIKVRAFNL